MKSIKERLKEIFEGLDFDDKAKSLLISDEFLIKVENLFETELGERINAKKDALKEETQDDSDAELETLSETLTETTSLYLDEFVEGYMTEKDTLVEQNTKARMFDGFFGELTEMMVKYGIPTSDGDGETVLDKIEENLQSTKTELNDKVKKLGESETKNQELQERVTLLECTKGLTDVQVEKIQSLLEGYKTKDMDAMKKRIGVLKESVIGGDTDTDAENDLLTEGTNSGNNLNKNTDRTKTAKKWGKY